MSTRTVALNEASESLADLLASVNQGDDVIITAADGSAARLVPFRQKARHVERCFGQYRGRIHIAEGFDAPLSDDFWLGQEDD